MEAQFNFQVKHRNNKVDWEDVAVGYQIFCDRTTAVRYARRISKIFQSEIRMTEEQILSKQAEHTFTKAQNL